MREVVVVLFLLLSSNFANASHIAITFDDLPCQGDGTAEIQHEINQRILTALDTFKAPAVGFVNEGKLYNKEQTAEKTAILKSWTDSGQTLGNHTYSHHSLNTFKLADFQDDVLKGSIVSKKIMKEAGLEYTYFRHPFLHTGTTKDVRSSFEGFLIKEGYVVAPATIDTDDWKFNQQLLDTPKDRDLIIQKYLEHTRAKFKFYEAVSQKMFGRNIKHIWLLHVNLINSYAMEDLLKIAKEKGYGFVTLDEVLEDTAYNELDNYYAPFGVSWLYRWDFTRGKVVDWSQDPEPDNNTFIESKSAQLFDESRNRFVPVECYVSGESKGKADAGIIKLPVAIINHGHTIKNTEYSFLAKALAAQGYFVASIQHQLPDDPAPVQKDTVFETRKPSWERGANNIRFVLSELQRKEPNIDLKQVVLIGHSGGGDMSLFFAEQHPELVSKVISLDSLRHPFPIKSTYSVLSLRANDTKADEGVLPESGATLIYLKEAKHMDMCDQGPKNVKLEVIEVINRFLRKDL
jgi:peptidoglycan/xylan/chitin deacetylase (PgdA/CDA1 family)